MRKLPIHRHASKFLLESLEPRQLLSAAVAQAATPVVDLTGSFAKIKLPAALIPGSKGKVTLTIVNNGNTTSTSPLNITLYLSTDNTIDASDTQIGGNADAKLKIRAGASKNLNLNVTLPAGTPADNYHILAQIEQVAPATSAAAPAPAKSASSSAILSPIHIPLPPTFIGNNNPVVSTQTYDVVDAPDLSIDITDISGISADGSTAAPGTSGTISVDITNDGGTSESGDVTVQLFLTTDGTLDNSPIQIGSDKVSLGDLESGDDSWNDINVTIPADTALGDYTIVAKMITGSVPDSDPTNNIANDQTLSIVAPFVDLTVWATVGSQPGPFALTQPVAANVSPVDATNSLGGTGTIAMPNWVPVWHPATATPVFPGDTTTVNASISNDGNISASGTATVNVYLSTDGTLDHAVLIGTADTTLTNLAAGDSSSVSVSVTIPADQAPGGYTLITQLVPGTAPDSDLTDNTATNSFTVAQPGPDLAATGVTLSDFNIPAQPGDSGNATVTVLNSGTVPLTGDANVTFYLAQSYQWLPPILEGGNQGGGDGSVGSTTGATLTNVVTVKGPISTVPIQLPLPPTLAPVQIGSGTITVTGLAPGNSATSAPIAITLPAGLSSGFYSVYAVVDANNSINQTNTTNDQSPGTFLQVGTTQVPPPILSPGPIALQSPRIQI